MGRVNVDTTTVTYAAVKRGRTYGFRTNIPVACLGIISAKEGDKVGWRVRGKAASVSRTGPGEVSTISRMGLGSYRLVVPVAVSSRLGLGDGTRLRWFIRCTSSGMAVEVEKGGR